MLLNFAYVYNDVIYKHLKNSLSMMCFWSQ